MPLESVTYIDDLVPAWPPGSDKRRQGDDHLRNIKLAIKNTFPNITGEVTATQDILNGIPANLTATIAAALDHLTPVGLIAMWSGNIASPPTGWAVCNGQTVSGFGVVPDLRDRFVVGAGNTYASNTSGGAVTKTTTTGGGVAAGTTGDHALTVAELPSISPRLYVKTAGDSDSSTVGFGNGSAAGLTAQTVGAGPYGYLSTAPSGGGNNLVEPIGGGQAHTHPIAEIAVHDHTVNVLPPYYAIAYIIKVTAYAAP